ncbi:MAG: PhnD/SsuA/transferrin family substrate-binding protein [Deltaproteobacteria bacterium]|nr:PhnD/SsuA/transferrin family substrate-binding protein [Deltaproteobacteria bacterium]
MARWMGYRAFGVALLCLLLLVRGAAGGDAGNPFGPKGLRFGYSARLVPELSRADAQAALELWGREFVRLSGYDVPYKLIVYDDLETFISAIRSDQVDFIALGSLEYLKIRGRVEMEPALIGEKNGKPGDEQVLLVRRDSGIRDLDQLRGGKLTLLQGAGGEIASLWLDNLLAKRGLPAAGRMFGAVKVVPKAQQVILPVFFRQADACIVGSNAFHTAVELNPQLAKELVAIETSPVYPIAVTCLRTTLTDEQKDEFIRMAFRLKDTTSGKQILTLFKVDNMSRGTDRVLDPLSSLVKESGAGKTASRGGR